MLKNLNSVLISGKEVLPLIEGGKGVAVSNGISSGSWALAGSPGRLKTSWFEFILRIKKC